MKKVEKQLRSIPRQDRERAMNVMEQITQRNFLGLDRKQLKGSQYFFRVRVGNYRIIYFDDGINIVFESIGRKNETTYSDF